MTSVTHAKHNWNGFEATNTWYPDVTVEKDLGHHGDTWPNESWFSIGSLQAEDGRCVGFCAHALVMEIPGEPLRGSLKVSMVDCKTGWYAHHEYLVPAEELTVGTDPDHAHIVADHFYLDVTPETMVVKVDIPEGGAIDIKCKRNRPLIYNCGNGHIPFCDVDQYHIGMPGFETEGSLTCDNVKFNVSGSSWFDRQWGKQPSYTMERKYDNMKWVWLGIQLDNGVSISSWDQYDLYEKKINMTTTVVFPDGSTMMADREPFAYRDYWESEESGNKYPTALDFEIPSLNAKLTAVCIPARQEVIAAFKPSCKVEAQGEIDGTFMGEPVHGVLTFELIGYWKEG